MMLFAVDENFNIHIVNGVLRRNADIQMLRVQDVGLQGFDDPRILAWAADEHRILLTHDVQTMIGFAYERITRGLPMPGIVEVPLDVPIRTAIEEIILLAECSHPNEWEHQIIFLPLT